MYRSLYAYNMDTLYARIECTREDAMLEKEIEKKLRERMKEIGGFCYKWVSPGNAGVPDRICIFPSGRVVFVEVKRKNGRLSAVQRVQIERLRRCRQEVATIWSVQGVDRMVEEMMR